MNKNPDKNSGGSGHSLLRRMSFIPAGAGIAVLVVLLVGGQSLWKFAHHPKHLDALAEESGNLHFVLENERPQISHDGARLLFCHSSEHGVGVFVCDVASGQKKMLFEEKEIHFGMGPHGVLTPFPWSPDDQWFVYAHQGPGVLNEEIALPEETILTICHADTDAEESSLIAPFGRVVALAWLTTNSFVYVDGTEAHDFMLAQRKESGAWRQTRLNTPAMATTNDNHFCALAAVASDTIVWLQANSLWRMNVASNSTEKLCELLKDKFYTSFDYSKETGQLLLSCIESKADSLWKMSLHEPGNLTKIATDVRTHDNLWNDAQWINGGRGYAFIRKPGLQPYGLVIKTDASAQTILFPTNYIQYMVPAPDQQRLFVLGEINSQPGESIWEYDTTTGSNRCLIAGFDQSPAYAQAVQREFKNIRISAAEKLDVVIFPPAGFDRNKHKKYPVVITSIRYALEDPYIYQYPEAIANAGAWYVLINHTWSPRSLDSWASHVRNLRDNMETNTAQFPNMDKRRIFVVSNSAQAMALADIFTNQPGAWRGAILLEPSTRGLPTPLETSMEQKPFRILITTESGGNPKALEKYQEDNAAEGVAVDWIIHPNTPHVFIAKRSQRDRIQAMLHFIFDE